MDNPNYIVVHEVNPISVATLAIAGISEVQCSDCIEVTVTADIEFVGMDKQCIIINNVGVNKKE